MNSLFSECRIEVLTTHSHPATDVEGIFRLSGSAKRIKDLQAVFDTPDRYGKGLDWTGYTVHDAANILRRYLNQLPQPIVPLEYYERFRDPLRSHQAQAVGDVEAQHQDIGNFDHAAAITTYQRLITEISPLNRQLLLYILDLLAVFSSKAEQNRMTSANLAAIFQPGMLSHPTHDMSPSEYRLSQDVIIFLIENQDNFLIGMSGTAADEKTVREFQSGAQPRQPGSPKPKSPAIRRSTSNASAGADSLRRFGGIRRNVSVSSKNSRSSQNMPSPISPPPGSPHASLGGSGVHRSNTVPSKRSPGIPPASRFRNPLDSPTPQNTKGPSPPGYLATTVRTSSPSSRLAPGDRENRSPSTHSSTTPTAQSPALNAVAETPGPEQNSDKPGQSEKLTLQASSLTTTGQHASGTPKAERKVSSLFSRSPTGDGERKELRQPNKLRKKRPESSNPSAHSSTHSLNAGPESPANQIFYTPLPTPGVGSQVTVDPMSSMPPTFSNTAASETPTPAQEITQEASLGALDQHQQSAIKALKPSKSPAGSVHSRSSVTDISEADQLDDSKAKSEKKKRGWRSSFSSKKTSEKLTASSSQLGVNPIAEKSSTSVTSAGEPRKSITDEMQVTGTSYTNASEGTRLPRVQSSSNESTPSKEHTERSREKEVTHDGAEKKGPIGWFKAKVAQAKEERKEREAEKERAKSPPRNSGGASESKPSLTAIAQDSIPLRGRSMEASREESQRSAAEPSALAAGEKS